MAGKEWKKGTRPRACSAALAVRGLPSRPSDEWVPGFFRLFLSVRRGRFEGGREARRVAEGGEIPEEGADARPEGTGDEGAGLFEAQ